MGDSQLTDAGAKLQSTMEDDIEKALEKEMDKMQSTTEDDSGSSTQMETLRPTEDLETALDRELDGPKAAATHPQTELDEDDLEKELERAMDGLNDIDMLSGDEASLGWGIAGVRRSTCPTWDLTGYPNIPWLIG